MLTYLGLRCSKSQCQSLPAQRYLFINKSTDRVKINFNLPRCKKSRAWLKTIWPHLSMQPHPLSEVMPESPIGTNPFLYVNHRRDVISFLIAAKSENVNVFLALNKMNQRQFKKLTPCSLPFRASYFFPRIQTGSDVHGMSSGSH